MIAYSKIREVHIASVLIGVFTLRDFYVIRMQSTVPSSTKH
jgi:hypothetical protein